MDNKEIMGNGSSYIIWISKNRDKVDAIHRPMMDMGDMHKKLDASWYWHVSTIEVLQDCRIPSLYHGKGIWATIVEHNNGDWDKMPTFEIHCI